MKYAISIIVIIVLIGLGIWFYQDQGGLDMSPGQTAGEFEPREYDISLIDLDTAQKFTITGRPYEYSIEEIRVKKGDTVVINFVNGQGTHDWVIDEFQARTHVLQTGEKEIIYFVADKKGEFQYYCSVGDHRDQGMWGTLIVE